MTEENQILTMTNDSDHLHLLLTISLYNDRQ